MSARCVAFADIRGDFRLLVTLLCQVANVAEFTDGKWKWRVQNTVVLCLGNYVDRFEPRGMNRFTISTRDAVNDEIRIIDAFSALEKQCTPENGNSVVVLAGDHELGNVISLPGYEYYQMARPQTETDREQRAAFVEYTLRPFLARHGVVAGWGSPGAGTVYFSHGSLTKKWFSRLGIKSLKEVNRTWQRWIIAGNYDLLKRFAVPDSPIMSSAMATKPQVWRDLDEDIVVQILGPDPYPRFVQSTMIPVQRMQYDSYDTALRTPTLNPRPKSNTPTMLASRNGGTDQIYLINNLMADTFCMYDVVDRAPQALEFTMKLDSNGDALFMNVSAAIMSLQEYNVYQNELPYGSCKPGEIDPSHKVQLTSEDMVAFRPTATEGTLDVLSHSIAHVESVGILIVSHDIGQVLLWTNPKTGRLTIPMGAREVDENDWDAMKRVLRETIRVDNLQTLQDGAVTDFEGSTRIWVRRTIQPIDGDGKVDLKWVALDDLFYCKTLDPWTKTMLCVLSKNRLIPELKGFDAECPSWLRPFDVHGHNRCIPWWAFYTGKGLPKGSDIKSGPCSVVPPPQTPIDEPLLKVLPKLRALAETAPNEHGVAIYESDGAFKYMYTEGSATAVHIAKPPGPLLIEAHTHPLRRYPQGTQHAPPSADDITQYLREFILKRDKMPQVYVVTHSGVWKIIGLTREAQDELGHVVTFNVNDPKNPILKEDFLDVAQTNANNNGGQLHTGKITVQQYVEEMKQLWRPGMGIEIAHYPYVS